MHGIPHFREAESFEVLDVGRCELGDSEGAEREGRAGVEDAAAGSAGVG